MHTRHHQVDPSGPRSRQQAQTGTDGYDSWSSSDSDDRRRPQTSSLHKSAVSSSSGMSPTCHLVNRLVRSPSLMKNQDMRRAIDSHRLTHIHKVKKELQRLERFNNVLTGVPTFPSSSEASRSTESIVHKPIPKKSNRFQPDFPPPGPKIVRETPPSTVLPNLKINRSQSSGVRNENTNTSRTELHNTGTQYSQSSIPKPVAASATSGNQYLIPSVSASSSTNNVALEQKLDQLLSTFNFIADFLCLNQEAAADASRDQAKGCSCPKKRKPKKPKPSKAPVSYFIPFNNCRGEQMYLQYGRQRSPPSLSSSENENEDQENEHHGQGQGEVDNDGRNGRYDTNKFVGRFSLQQIFQQHHPEIINRVQQREEILSKLKLEREHRAEVKRQWIRAHGPHELSSLERALEPREPRLMSGLEMRQITKKTYTKLPEVQEKKLQKKAVEEKKTNRLMSRVFAKKLRQGVLKGNVNMDMSKSIIANATLLR